MINEPPYKYVFSSDFLSEDTGSLNRFAAEKMRIVICEPETTTMQNVANAVFTGNLDTGGKPEEDGIFKSLPNEVLQDVHLILMSSVTKLLLKTSVKKGNGESSSSDGD